MKKEPPNGSGGPSATPTTPGLFLRGSAAGLRSLRGRAALLLPLAPAPLLLVRTTPLQPVAAPLRALAPALHSLGAIGARRCWRDRQRRNRQPQDRLHLSLPAGSSPCRVRPIQARRG